MNKIPYEERARVYAAALKTFGGGAQLVKALEELTEVQLEIHRALNNRANLPHLAEEVADATIMLEQVRQMFAISDLVCEYMDAKVIRLEQRVEEARRPPNWDALDAMGYFLRKYNITPKELETDDNEEGRAGAAAPRG